MRSLRLTAFALGLSLATAACSSGSGETTTAGKSTSSSTGSGAGGDGGGGGSLPTGPQTPKAEFLPKATGPCPPLAEGKATFTPDGKARDVLLWLPDSPPATPGPLVFFWHGAGGDPDEAPDALGPALDEIKAMGGTVVAPYHDPVNDLLPWFLVTGGDDQSDLRVADEALACAIAENRVDLQRIYSVGFSAGAMNNTQFVALRSGYLASIVDYSGARIGTPAEQDDSNHYPAMLFYGGPNDMVVVNFQDESIAYQQNLADEGHFSFLCNHNMGHTVPADGRASAWQFLKDHPFKLQPEPYKNGLPAGFPSYCTLPSPQDPQN